MADTTVFLQTPSNFRSDYLGVAKFGDNHIGIHADGVTVYIHKSRTCDLCFGLIPLMDREERDEIMAQLKSDPLPLEKSHTAVLTTDHEECQP